MTALREAALLVLDALENHAMQKTYAGGIRISNAAIALREALAESEQEPMAWMDREGDIYRMPEIKNWAPPHTFLYTTPPQRQPLTEESLLYLYNQLPNWGMDMDNLPPNLEKFARAIERAHGIGEKR